MLLLLHRIAASVILLALIVRAALPVLPMYVCAGMGGMHLLHPCCPSPSVDTTALDSDATAAGHSDEDARLSARCCERADLPSITLQSAPRSIKPAIPIARDRLPSTFEAIAPSDVSPHRLLASSLRMRQLPRTLAIGPPHARDPSCASSPTALQVCGAVKSAAVASPHSSCTPSPDGCPLLRSEVL